MKTHFLDILMVSVLVVGCEPQPIDVNPIPVPVAGDTYRGMYVLNEGGYNQNNASLDYLDFASGTYVTDTFTRANPSVIQGLGDTGNDILVYGSKAYICVNGSGLVEIIDARSARHLAQVNLSNCRRLCAHEGYIYITSYAGRVEDHDHQLGYVAKMDTISYQIVATCEVGYQPEAMAVVDGKIYVANSGGYMGMNTGVYDDRISVITLADFTQTKHIPVGVNPQDIQVDSQHRLWIVTYGNYVDVAANLYCLDPQTEQITAQNIPVTKMAMTQDTLVYYATTYDAMWNPVTEYAKFATQSCQVLAWTLSNAPASPNGLGVHPTTGHIYVADAGDYVSPGSVVCYSRTGDYQWKVYAGVVPGHFAWVK